MDLSASSTADQAGGSSQPVERPLPMNHQFETARDALSKGVFRLSLLGKMNPRAALELVAIFQIASRLFNVDCSFGVLDSIRSALTVSPVETLADVGAHPESEVHPWMWANQLCDETACYSRIIVEGGSLVMYHNQRMEENFMETAELYSRVRGLRLLPLFHWAALVHPADIPIFYEAMSPIMVGHGVTRQTDVVVKCRKKSGAFVPCLVTFRCARGPTEGNGGIVMRIWPLETRVFLPQPRGEPRGHACVIQPVAPGPIRPPPSRHPSPTPPPFFPAPSPLAPSSPLPVPSPPPMACPPFPPQPQLLVPPPPRVATHSHPFAGLPPRAPSWAPPMDPPPRPLQAPPAPPRIDMPPDELQTLLELFGGTAAGPRQGEAANAATGPAPKVRRTDDGARGAF